MRNEAECTRARCYRAFVDNTDASVTGTYHRNIRFMSAQRGKKTRSAASRYRRYVRLTSTTGELRLQLIKCQSKKKKKDTPSESSVQSVGVRVHTPPRLHYLRSGWAPGSVQCLCLSDGFDLRSFLSAVTPYARQLHRHADPTRNLACLNSQRPL